MTSAAVKPMESRAAVASSIAEGAAAAAGANGSGTVGAAEPASERSFSKTPLSSRIRRCAVFLPTPGTVAIPLSSSIITNVYNSGTVNEDRIARASLAPTPLTETSLSNIVRSSFVANPNRVHESSRTTMRVYRRVGEPTCARPMPFTSMTADPAVASMSVPFNIEIMRRGFPSLACKHHRSIPASDAGAHGTPRTPARPRHGRALDRDRDGATCEPYR